MLSRSALLLGLFATLSFSGYSQCVVSQDAQKRVITTCQFYAPKGGLLINRPDRSQAVTQVVYLGSEYLSYPIWQDGSLEIGDPKKTIPCKIAYNVVSNEVKCMFEGDAQEYTVQPDAFTVNGNRFISQVINKAGKTSRVYYMVLYAGKTKLLEQFRCTLSLVNREAYTMEEPFDGTFRRQKDYYIQRENEAPRLVTLSRKSVLNVLDDQSNRLTRYLTQKKITVYQLVDAVAYYDGFQ